MSTPAPSGIKSRFSFLESAFVPYIFLFVLSCSLCGNLLQAWKLRRLHRDEIAAQSPPIEVRVGQRLQLLQLRTALGDQASLPFTNRTVIYVFSPTCHWCAKNLANIKALALLGKANYNFIGISNTSDGLAQYLGTSKLPFPVYVDSNAADLKELDYLGTPQTLVIQSGGVVEHNWPGAYSGASRMAIEKYFKVLLPGLSES